jgi:hypothetical protein
MCVQQEFRYGDFGTHHIVTCISDCRPGFGLANRFIGYSQVVTTISSYTLKITITITHERWTIITHKAKSSTSACLVTR